ncbi:LOW QUALITY PROTEIN: UDP-glycosyltransferase 86A1-like [Arachis stenosperma]|uniref:LOW QUALITY PROTEIN: UDP-glycosyltransferase 86A1-like n=1 Tax=Arachis stenosperma TaxID=217475 RepID=UPI0025AC0BDB|nr:LOW QUALITY PROTEIN: UDP-glycosyltransferase 86A1-like [Arachis stenosperma]
MAAREKKGPHAILIAYPLQGHLIPSVHLAINLASRGFTITFVNTYSIHHQTTKAINGNCSGEDIFAAARESGLDIRYDTVSDGLPVELDRSLNHDEFMSGLVDLMPAHVEKLVAKIMQQSSPPVTCLVVDTFFVWGSPIAKKFGLLCVSFWTEPALVYTLYYHMDLLKKNGHFACQDNRKDPIDYIPGVKTIEPKDLTSYLQDDDANTWLHQLIFAAFNDVRGADFVLCNTVQELEPQVIEALQSYKPFYAIGPIFPRGFTNNATVATSLWSESDCTQWLNSKPHGSVLYASFGSYAHITKTALWEIANGLLLSNVSFVWVLRPDIVSSNDVDPLPVGFKEAVRGRGMIIHWCSQTQVLTHPAIGGFLTHCGWNSILESIWCEVPLLCFPLLTDQFTNRKLVVDDWKIGINLIDNQMVVTKEEVLKNVNRFMDEKIRNQLKATMGGIKKKLEYALGPGGSCEKNMECFVKELNAKSNIIASVSTD